jgi:hypothetical protein
MSKAPKGEELHPIDADINRIIAMVRAQIEHPFRVQAPVRLSRDPLPGAGQELGTTLHAVRPLATCSWSDES